MADTTANIQITTQGGDKAAADMQKVAGGIAQAGNAAKTSAPEVAKIGQVQSAGINLFSSAIFRMIPGMQQLGPVARIVSAEMRVLMGSMGGLAGPIGIVVTALAILTIGWLNNRKAQAEANKATAEAINLHTKLAAQIEALVNENVKLTPEIKALNEAIQTQLLIQTSQLALDTRHEIALKRKTLATTNDIVEQIKLKDEITILIQKMKAQEQGYTSLEDKLGKLLEKRRREIALAKEQRAEWEKGAAIADKTAKEIVNAYAKQTEAAERWATRTAQTVSGVVMPAISDWMRETGLLADTTDANMSRVEKRWRMLGNAVVEELVRIATQKIAFEIIGMMIGGAGGAAVGGAVAGAYGPAFAYGGVVPGKQGEPQMIMAHGGERVTNANGRGGKGGEGGGNSFTVNVQGGIGGLDDRSIRDLITDVRYAVVSKGEVGLS